MSKINTDHFFRMVGDKIDDSSDLHFFSSFFEGMNFNYNNLGESETKSLCEVILASIKGDRFEPSSPKRQSKWENGWAENLREFLNNPVDQNALIPKYYKPSKFSRWNSAFITTESETFQYDFFQVLRLYLTSVYFKNFEHLYEFGCGPAHNIAWIGKMYPNMHYVGLDWAKSSVEIIEKLAKTANLNCEGKYFNFFKPDTKLVFFEGTVVVTFGGLEQIGDKHDRFIQFLLEKKPDLVVNVEPIIEFYDEENDIDSLAIEYSRKRNYLRGYFTRLMVLQKRNKVYIQKAFRVPFGGLYHEGWSVVIWRPL